MEEGRKEGRKEVSFGVQSGPIRNYSGHEYLVRSEGLRATRKFLTRLSSYHDNATFLTFRVSVLAAGSLLGLFSLALHSHFFLSQHEEDSSHCLAMQIPCLITVSARACPTCCRAGKLTLSPTRLPSPICTAMYLIHYCFPRAITYTFLHCIRT